MDRDDQAEHNAPQELKTMQQHDDWHVDQQSQGLESAQIQQEPKPVEPTSDPPKDAFVSNCSPGRRPYEASSA